MSSVRLLVVLIATGRRPTKNQAKCITYNRMHGELQLAVDKSVVDCSLCGEGEAGASLGVTWVLALLLIIV